MHLSVSWSQLVCCDAKIILVSHLQEVYMYLYFSQFIIYSLILSIFVRVCNSSFKCQWIHISGDSRKHEHVWMAAHIFQALLHWEVRMIGGGDFWWDLLLVHYLPMLYILALWSSHSTPATSPHPPIPWPVGMKVYES